MRLKSLCIVALLGIAGCSSTPPISYYSLDMTPSGRVSTNAAIHVETLRTTEALARTQIQIQASPTRIEYYATHEWAGGIGELVGRKLAVEFNGDPSGGPQLTLSGSVLECTQVDIPQGAEARMAIAVTVRDSASPRYVTPLINKIFTSTKSVGRTGPDAVVQALSRCAEDIAVEIAEEIEEAIR